MAEIIIKVSTHKTVWYYLCSFLLYFLKLLQEKTILKVYVAGKLSSVIKAKEIFKDAE